MKLGIITSSLVLSLAACDAPQYQCSETACKPDWSGDCYCNRQQYIDPQKDGTIICRCKENAPSHSPPATEPSHEPR